MESIMAATQQGDIKSVIEFCDFRKATFDPAQAFSALCIAARLGYKEIAVNILCALTEFNPNEDYFLKLDPRTRVTFLHQAILSKQEDFVRFFLKGFNLPLSDILDNRGNTLLHSAAKCDLTSVVTDIVKRVSSLIDAQTPKGKTALYFAVKNNQVATVKILLENKADINMFYSKKNETVMHLAARSDFVDLINILLAYAPILHPDLDRNTPYDVAKFWRHSVAAELILDYQNQHTFSAYRKLLLDGLEQPSFPIVTASADSESEHKNYLLKYSAIRPRRSISELNTESDRIEHILDLGQNLGHRLAYAHPPDGLDLILWNEDSMPNLFRSYTIYSQNGIRCYALLPHNRREDIYVLMAGTDDEASLKRDITEETPGCESFKAQARGILIKLSQLLDETYRQNGQKKCNLKITGHSLGAGDSFALFVALLKCIANNKIETMSHLPDERAFYETLKANWSGRTIDEIEIMRDKAIKNTMDSTFKHIPFPEFSRIQVIALNSVLISRKAQFEYEGVVTYAKILCPEMQLESYNQIVPSDFANLTGDAYPLIHLPTEIMKIYTRVTHVNTYALEAGISVALMGIAMNPSLVSNSNANTFYGMLVAGCTAAFTLGPIGIIPTMLLTGIGIKASHVLFEGAFSSIVAPHQHLPSEDAMVPEKKSVNLSNLNPIEREQMICAINDKQVAKLIFDVVKHNLASSLSTPKLAKI
jgi:ankyrin repeat protein